MTVSSWRAWRVIGASVQGTAHRRQNLPCQDAHAYRLLPDGALLVAVADGAGSAPRSAEGALCAAQAAIAALASSLEAQLPSDESVWQAVMRDAFARARDRLAQTASDAGAPLPHFATTLTCAIIAPGCVATGSVGDGALIAAVDERLVMLPALPQKGEYANETNFLTQDDALDRLEAFVHAQAVRALAVTTDGLLRLAVKMPDYTPHAPFFQPLFDFAAQASGDAEAELAAFLASERVCARTDDDKTLVLAALVAPVSLPATAYGTAPLST